MSTKESDKNEKSATLKSKVIISVAVVM